MRKTSFLCALLLAPALASAQPKTPDEWYREGETAYNLGNFAEAIDAFKKGFALETSDSKKVAYLYNIAQSYRFMGNECTNAKFFYKRYLALRDSVKPPDSAHRTEIEARIKDLEACEQQNKSLRDKPPNGNPVKPDEDPTTKPEKDRVGTTEPEDGTDEPDDGSVTKSSDGAPRVISLRLVGGAAKIVATDALSFPVQATGALIGGYPLAVNEKVTLELGAGFSFTPLSFRDEATMEDRSAKLIGLFANVGATYHVAPKFGIRGDLGLGALFFTGISESLFTDGRETSGALTMFHARVGLSADYAVTPNFVVTATPIAFSYSPAKSGLREDIDSIRAFDFMAGVGYRM